MFCTLVTRSAAGGLLALAFSATAAAQADERVLYACVFDEKTRTPVTGLGPDDFVVAESGVRREVLRVTRAISPLSVVVLVDNTEAAKGTIADLRRALATFFRTLDGIGPMALVSVADRPTILLDYTTDPRQLQDAVGRVFAQPGSGATLLDAIVEVSRGIDKREEDRAAIVVVTTENVEFSTRHYRDVLQALGRSGAMLSAVVLSSPRDELLTDEARNRASVLDLGPRDSGGMRFDVLTSLAYEGRLQELAAILKSQHRVVYARPKSLIPPDRTDVAAARAGLEAHGAPARKQGR
jgi:hypothetical protein